MIDKSKTEAKREVKGSQVFGFKTPKPKSKIRELVIKEKEKAEEYFETNQRSETSDRTLNRLKTPRLTQEDIDRLLTGQPVKYEKEIHKLLGEYRSKFLKWHILLRQSFNLVFFGYGSKKALLEEFANEQLKPRTKDDVIVVNGFFPSLTVKHILNAITFDIVNKDLSEDELDHKKEAFGSGIPEQLDYIRDHLKTHVYLIVHNIDGHMLRNEKSQSTLSRLASFPNIHLVCSVDHINAPLLWDQKKMTEFNFLWVDATTFLPYDLETRNEVTSLLVKDSASGTLALNSLTHVFASLSPNARAVYTKIIKYQLEVVIRFSQLRHLILYKFSQIW